MDAGVLRSFLDRPSCEEAVRILRTGQPIGLFVQGTTGIAVDAHNPVAASRVYAIKGERRQGMPFATLVSAEQVVERIDLDLIPPPLRRIFADPAQLASRLGALVFIRFPVRPSAAEALPPHVLSQRPDGRRWMQSWIHDGYAPTLTWFSALAAGGISIIAVTSMNVSGEPEIVEREKGAAFCRDHGIPLFLASPEGEERRGSFPIIQLEPDRIRVIRDAHFPGSLFADLLDGAAVDLTGARPARLRLVDPGTRSARGPALRRLLLERIDGKS